MVPLFSNDTVSVLYIAFVYLVSNLHRSLDM